jgi:hypothetical protein
VGNEAKDDSSKDFSTFNGTGTGTRPNPCKLYDNNEEKEEKKMKRKKKNKKKEKKKKKMMMMMMSKGRAG